MFKFLHAADIHLDSPLLSLSQYPGAPVEKIRLATREALTNLVRLAIDEAVAFVVIAGDVYDGDWDDYNTGHYFNVQMSKLANAKIPVYLISGNHDAQNKMTRNLPLPTNVYRFATNQPETVHLENLPVSLHGQGFATQRVTEDLTQYYPAAESGRFNIGILHTNVDGREGHDNYAPCSSKALIAKGYDYWALGHIHQREILRERHPMIAYSGNLQGRHIGETGAKGCLLIEVDANHQITRHTFRSLDAFRWERCLVDLADIEHPQDIFTRFEDRLHQIAKQLDGRAAAVRVVLTGSCPLHASLFASQSHWIAQIQATASNHPAGSFWVEKVKFKTTPLKTAAERDDLNGPIAELSACVREWTESEERLLALRELFKDVKSQIPAMLLEGADGIKLDDPAWLREMLKDAETLAIARLVSQEEIP